MNNKNFDIEINGPINMYDPKRDTQTYKKEYDDAIQSVIKSGLFINGPQVKELEEKLANYVNVKHCVCLSNGTDALTVAMLALGIGSVGKPNKDSIDEVITVAHTWISSSETISLIGAKPVFVDIRDDTFCINEELIEKAITENTKAILVVSLYGHMPDMDKIDKISSKYGIPVIEDGAQSFGATYNGTKSSSCSYSIVATTSFFPSKPIGCWGDGGACFTNDDELATKMKAVKNHGGLVRFKHEMIGFNARLDTLQAAILLVKLGHFDHCLKKRNSVAKYYSDSLKELEDSGKIVLPKTKDNCYHVWGQYPILVKEDSYRDKLFDHLKNSGINVAIFYPKPLHYQQCFEYLGYKDGDLPTTERVCRSVINLPCYAELTESEQVYICQVFKDFFYKN